jgi:hypothetical protein
VLGVGLLLFAAMYVLTASLPARERVRDLQRELVQTAGKPATDTKPTGDIESDLAAFYGFFGRSGSVSEALAKVDESIAASGMAFEAAEYRLVRDPALRLTRYEVTVPLRGTYAQVRTFVGTLLDGMPQVALEDVAVKRESVASPAIEARLRLSIHMVLP